MHTPGLSQFAGSIDNPAKDLNKVMKRASVGQVGWRLVAGAALIGGGYAALGALPFVAAADIGAGSKSALATFVALLPPIAKVAAVALMGKPGFQLLKGVALKLLQRLRPAREVGRLRYRVGLVLFVAPLVLDWLEPFAPQLFGDWRTNAILWSLVGDLTLVAGLLVLGGDFWDRLRGLFVYPTSISFAGGRVLLPAPDGRSPA